MDCKLCGAEIYGGIKDEPELLCAGCFKEYKLWLIRYDYFIVIMQEQNRGYAGKRSQVNSYPHHYYDYSTDDLNDFDYIIDQWQA